MLSHFTTSSTLSELRHPSLLELGRGHVVAAHLEGSQRLEALVAHSGIDKLIVALEEVVDIARQHNHAETLLVAHHSPGIAWIALSRRVLGDAGSQMGDPPLK